MGAVAVIAFGLDFLGTWTVSAVAFVSGLATVLLVYAMSRSGGRTEVVTLILTGIALNAFAGALIGLFLFFADTAAVNQITFWQLGSLARTDALRLRPVLATFLVGYLCVAVNSYRYFFAGPVIAELLIALCLGLAIVAAKRGPEMVSTSV